MSESLMPDFDSLPVAFDPPDNAITIKLTERAKAAIGLLELFDEREKAGLPAFLCVGPYSVYGSEDAWTVMDNRIDQPICMNLPLSEALVVLKEELQKEEL